MGASLSYSILIDNAAHAPGLEAEHGLSIWIDTGSARILFDTGQSGASLRNARTLGIDVASADCLVLSHGHYDHTGGLAALDPVLPPEIPIHAHPGIFPPRYSRHADGTIHEIGLPDTARAVLDRRKNHVQPVTAPAEIAPGVWLSGPVPRMSGFEDTGGDFWLDAGCTVPDPVADDLSLWVEREEGLWIFLGCAHAGAVNIVRHIMAMARRNTVYAVIGGMHLRHALPGRLEKTAAFFRELAPTVFLPCHCSGSAISLLP